MQFKIAVSKFKLALQRAQGVATTKTIAPILSHVLITAEGSGIEVTAFDLDIGVTSSHQCDVEIEGGVTLPAKRLLDIVQSLPDENVVVRTSGAAHVELISGSAKFKLVSLSADEFPKLPRRDDVTLTPVATADLLTLLRKTLHAMSTDDSRYVLNGVFMEREGKFTRMVSTDGHRMAMADVALSDDFAVKAGVILPRKGVLELKRLLEEGGDTCLAGLTENSLVLERPSLTFVMRLIDGQFPEYRRVIPRTDKSTLVVGREILSASLKRIALMSADKSSMVKVTVDESSMTVAALNPDIGEASETLSVDYSGPRMELGFNAKFMLEALTATESTNVELELRSMNDPCVVRGVGSTDASFIIMPMRV